MTERLRHVPNSSRRSPPASNCSKTGLRRQTVEIPIFWDLRRRKRPS